MGRSRDFRDGTGGLGAAVMARQDGKPPADGVANAKPETVAPLAVKELHFDRDQTAGALKTTEIETPKPEIDELRNRLVQAARREWSTALEDFRLNLASLDRALQASKHLLSAEENAFSGTVDRRAAGGHLERMRDLSRTLEGNPSATDGQRALVKANAAEAELLAALAAVKVPGPQAAKTSTTAGEAPPEQQPGKADVRGWTNRGCRPSAEMTPSPDW